MSRRIAAWTGACVAGAALAAGCASDLQLRRDARLRFVSPPGGALVRTPVVVEWRIARKDFRPVRFDGSRDPHRGVFAVFVDRSPMAPGDGVDALAAGDRVCAVSPGCPDRAWLAEHGVYLTRRPAIALGALSSTAGRAAGGRRRHEITVALLDGRGTRIGESSWTRAFSVPARGER